MNGWQEQKFVHHWRKKHIKTWWLMCALVLFALLSAHLLRQNNLRMVELRSAVVMADEQGGDVSGALQKLNRHIFHHMNTQIVRPVELVGTYNRQSQAVIEAANKASGRDVYSEATANCEQRGIPLTSIAQCAAEYAMANNPTGSKQIVLPNKELYKHSFVSPIWTPDLAGFAVLITGVIMLWLAVRLCEAVLVRLIVRRRIKNGF